MFLINSKCFFTEDSKENGICLSADFLNHISNLDAKELQKLSDFFGHISKGRNVQISDSYTDRFNIPYRYVNVYYRFGNGRLKFKVTEFQGIEKLMDILLDKKVVLDLEELINRAKELQPSHKDEEATSNEKEKSTPELPKGEKDVK